MSALSRNTNKFFPNKGLVKMAAFLLVFLTFFFTSLSAQKPNEEVLRKLTSESVDTATAAITVYVFFSPECPICISTIKELKDLAAIYTAKNVMFKMIFSGAYYSDKAIRKFCKQYAVPIAAYNDKYFLFAKQLGATVTPTVFVYNQKMQKVYQGKVNNQYEGIGQRRTIVTERYLKEAIEATMQYKLPTVAQTEAVGCFMGYTKE